MDSGDRTPVDARRKRRAQLFRQGLRLLGLLLFVVILVRLDFDSLLRVLSEADPILLLLSVPFFIPNFLTKSVRWSTILKEQGYHISLWDLFLFNMVGFYVGSITPGRVGEFVRVFYLRNQGVPTETSLVVVLLERVLDMLVIGSISLLAVPLVVPEIELGTAALAALAVVLAAGVLLRVAAAQKWGERLVGWPRWPIPDNLRQRLMRGIRGIGQAVIGLQGRTVLLATFLTLLSLAIMYSRLYLLVLALHIDLSFLEMSATAAVAQLVALLPITISGIGTRDAVYIYAFSSFGLAPELAVAFSFLVLLSYLLNTLFGLGAWLIRPINYRTATPKVE